MHKDYILATFPFQCLLYAILLTVRIYCRPGAYNTLTAYGINRAAIYVVINTKSRYWKAIKLDRKVKIKRVYMDDLSADESVDISLELRLSNRHIIIFSLNDKVDDPRFAGIVSGRCRDRPCTDGERVFWPGGPSIELDEILSMLKKEERHTRKRARKGIYPAELQ